MNDEIKEILDRIETASEIFDCLLKPEECTEILDFITNLQKTNKNHSKKLIELGNKITNLQQENERLKENINDDMTVYLKGLEDGKEKMKQCFESIYKSRCEKASEYIKSEKEHYLTKGCLIADTNNANLIVSAAVNTCNCSLNILQNGSDE